jgi:osmoprotectant transport system permease protein
VVAALQPLIGAITVEAMREANFAVDREDAGKLTPKAAAEGLAKQAGL